ncbi:hypothetical protein [uncultured Paraglaciecola sp.]|uniref:hypothetical protein n=1 Tax=uncultured Paraglaciecola sp. TaxID=1765024 RepID=UPI0030DB6C63|tara:strand:- start:181973 stop:183322 length:1350 start_codon:yes stop_codon:yes gene_type:complete
MASSYRQFIDEVYEEHVEEASFLYEQRLAFYVDQELPWFSYYSEELKLEAHLDGLIIGGQRALSKAQEMALEGDVGAIYTLLSLYCQLDQADKCLDAINEFDLDDPEVTQAIQLALLHRMPLPWIDSCLQKVANQQLILLSLFLPVLIKFSQVPSNIAFNRLVDGTFSDEQIDRVPFIQATANFSELHSNEFLQHFMINGCAEEKNAAVFSAFRLGRKLLVDQIMPSIAHHELPLLSIATGASHTFFEDLIANDQVSWNETRILCLAIGGLAEFIPELIKLLKDEENAEFAAKALFIITGATLLENVFQEDSWDKEDLFEDEIEAFEKGVMPQRTDGRPFGEEVEKLTSSVEGWLKWWELNHGHYVSGKRYRLGLLISPVSLVSTLNADNLIRELSYQELIIRYKASQFFSTQDCIQAQQKSMIVLNQWAQTVEEKYDEGEWYFSGNKQ